MQIESLKMFCDVVETGSFSAAARKNRVTQSAVSQQVRALEVRYGQKLLSRSAHAAVPTPTGNKLYLGAKELLESFSALESSLREESNELSGEIVIATIYSVGLHELGAHLKTMLRRHPKVNVRLVYERADAIIDDVLADRAHIGIVAYPSARPGLQVVPFRSDELVLCLAKDHPLANRRTIQLTDLEGMRFIAFNRDIPTGKAIDRILRNAPVQVQVVMEMDNVETMKSAVELGLGIAILPKATVREEELGGSLVTRSFSDGTFTRPIGMLLRKGRYLERSASAVLEILSSAPKH